APASCSFSIPMICSSVNREGRIVRLRDRRTLPKSGGSSGSQVTPDPTLMVREPDIFWGLVMSFWIGNLMLLVLNIALIGLWIRLLQLPFHYLYPAILVFVCIGVYSAGNSTFDV